MPCSRCGGLKVVEQFYGVDATVPAWTCVGFRCLNCGAIVFHQPTKDERLSQPRITFRR